MTLTEDSLQVLKRTLSLLDELKIHYEAQIGRAYVKNDDQLLKRAEEYFRLTERSQKALLELYEKLVENLPEDFTKKVSRKRGTRLRYPLTEEEIRYVILSILNKYRTGLKRSRIIDFFGAEVRRLLSVEKARDYLKFEPSEKMRDRILGIGRYLRENNYIYSEKGVWKITEKGLRELERLEKLLKETSN